LRLSSSSQVKFTSGALSGSKNKPGEYPQSDEYASGCIPGAVNVPLSGIQNTTFPTDKPLFF
jgi:hypothetical protein